MGDLLYLDFEKLVLTDVTGFEKASVQLVDVRDCLMVSPDFFSVQQ